jgi:hypothetical protein
VCQWGRWQRGAQAEFGTRKKPWESSVHPHARPGPRRARTSWGRSCRAYRTASVNATIATTATSSSPARTAPPRGGGVPLLPWATLSGGAAALVTRPAGPRGRHGPGWARRSTRGSAFGAPCRSHDARRSSHWLAYVCPSLPQTAASAVGAGHRKVHRAWSCAARARLSPSTADGSSLWLATCVRPPTRPPPAVLLPPLPPKRDDTRRSRRTPPHRQSVPIHDATHNQNLWPRTWTRRAEGRGGRVAGHALAPAHNAGVAEAAARTVAHLVDVERARLCAARGRCERIRITQPQRPCRRPRPPCVGC